MSLALGPMARDIEVWSSAAAKQRAAGSAATLQVRAKRWVTVRKVRSKGAKDVVTVNLPKGRYRVLVPAQYGMAKQTSKAVRIRR